MNKPTKQARSWTGAGLALALVLTMAGCAVPLYQDASAPAVTATAPTATPRSTVPGAVTQGKSRWVPVPWTELPGWGQDALHEAWNAWLKSCERPPAAWQPLCPQIRQLSIASPQEQRAWIEQRLQPYRVETLQGESQGLLTSYFEPTLDGSRQQTAAFTVPLYALPASLGQRKPWFTRQEMDTLPEAQAQLQGRVLAYVADPVDALVLQIQGSGRIRMVQADGSVQWMRVAYAGTNDQPYRSVGRWLMDQGLSKDGSWPAIKAWLAQNPQRQQELMWANPRVTFFKEETLSELEAAFGPKGGQGVALTPGRSIAIDPQSIPYGTPVWLVSNGPQAQLQKLVLAQDTGTAITGAVRADYFAGWGSQAGDLAGRMRQTLQMWIFWPKVPG
ncbi:MltA domain-containing protein [Curvibacter sp. CHRR-16]|uniref:murein transglycosylase A n=1 Tax=Curvibacter sp. CHRR-16 TaxID=2835872 RepID=UPI001BD9AE2C|nr:MltA domain-containing protein [Curvibacter sp. CHRR-16]MBT0570430.1 MltA domain-containing protein [Curvibacter sp. CHRR-16]